MICGLAKADIAWSGTAGSKNLDKTVSFYSEDALALPPNEAAVTGKDAIGKTLGRISGFADQHKMETSIKWPIPAKWRC